MQVVSSVLGSLPKMQAVLLIKEHIMHMFTGITGWFQIQFPGIFSTTKAEESDLHFILTYSHKTLM